MISPPNLRQRSSLLVASLLVLAGSVFGNEVVIPFGAEWKYLDDGSEQGSAWTRPGFDDSAWASGPGQLGYGERDETSVVGFGPDPTDKHLTTYFRHSFNIPDPSALPGLKLELLRDDGALVYLNGIEVGRSNMPTGVIDSTTPAATGLAGAAERLLDVIIVQSDWLVPGRNTIAVEIHQEAPSSSDMSFDLRATDVISPAAPQLENALLAITSSEQTFDVTALDIRASDWDSDEASLRFTVSGVEAGRFELAAAPGLAITTFTQAQLSAGDIRFVPADGRFGGARTAGDLALPLIHNEISGLVPSIQTPDLLWAHEDSNNPAALIALRTDASTHSEWTLSGLSNTDWEDIAAATVAGQALLYIGDFGDNDAVRGDLKIYRVKEPLLTDDDDGGTIPAGDIETIDFQYPISPAGEGGGSQRDAESMIVDPHTGDIYILTKRETVGRLFRLVHQPTYTGIQTLEYLGDMPAIIHDTIYGFSSSSTAADISRDGLEVLVRNYGNILYFQRPDLETSIAEMLTGPGIEELPFIGIGSPGIEPPGEPVGESICFDAAGDGYFTIGETPSRVAPNPLFYYRRLAQDSPPAFLISVSDGGLSDGPYQATVLIDAGPIDVWRHHFFSPAELGDPSLEISLWGELADPDGDGRPNLVEYALGRHPQVADEDGIVISSDSGSLTFTYERDRSKSDILYQVQASSDLNTWIDTPGVLLDTDGEIETWMASVDGADGARWHLRLRISSTPILPVAGGSPQNP